MADGVEVVRFERLRVVTVLCPPEQVEGRLNDTLTAHRVDAQRLVSIQSVATGGEILTVVAYRE